RYDELRVKATQAKLSESLDGKQRSSEYAIIDAANYPLLPAKPNRPLIMIVCILSSMFAGVVVAAGVDVINQKIWTHSELERLAGLPIIGEIADIARCNTAIQPTTISATQVRPRFLLPAAVSSSVIEPEEDDEPLFQEGDFIYQLRHYELDGRTGIVRLNKGKQFAQIYLKDGMIQAVSSNMEDYRLTRYLKKENLVNDSILNHLLKTAAKRDVSTGEAAVVMGIVSPAELNTLLMRQATELLDHVMYADFQFGAFDPSGFSFKYPVETRVEALLLGIVRRRATVLRVEEHERICLKKPKALPWDPAELSVLGQIASPCSFSELEAKSGMSGPELEHILSTFLTMGVIEVRESERGMTTALTKRPGFWLDQIIPKVNGSLNPMIVTDSDSHTVIGEQFRSLKVQINRLRITRPIQILSICSPHPGDGKSTVAVNMALSFAREAGRRVVLVDCDLRNPRLHSLLGITDEPGLHQYLQNEHWKPYACLRRFKDLYVVTAGGPSMDSVELLSMKRMHELLAFLRTGFDTIILDCPALEPVSDSQILAGISDGVVVVVRSGKTPYRSAMRAFKSMDRSNVLGAVFNGVGPMMFHSSYDLRSYHSGGDGVSSPPASASKKVRRFRRAAAISQK
ncbi:MAG TPA: AAA family ATPase, partial [Terriglobia bacterium]|nr:AAA family ATPase [Terriglobia bacterium]